MWQLERGKEMSCFCVKAECSIKCKKRPETEATFSLFMLFTITVQCIYMKKKAKMMWFIMSVQRIKKRKNIKYWNYVGKRQTTFCPEVEWLCTFTTKEEKQLVFVVLLLHLDLATCAQLLSFDFLLWFCYKKKKKAKTQLLFKNDQKIT